MTIQPLLQLVIALALSVLVTTRSVAEEKLEDSPKYVPPAIKPEDILPGTTKQFRFTPSKIFPGTVREVTVFIPAQYDGTQPACVYLKTDGFNGRLQSKGSKVMSKPKKSIIEVQGTVITILAQDHGDYISLTDMVRNFEGGGALIEQWLKNKDTVLFLGVWERFGEVTRLDEGRHLPPAVSQPLDFGSGRLSPSHGQS